MNTSLQKELSLLPNDRQGDVFSTQALRWTPDNKLVISCAEKIFIVNVVLAHELRSSSQEIYACTIDETISFDAFGEFSLSDGVCDLGFSFPYMSDFERQKFMIDPLLITEGFLRGDGHKVIKTLKCSSFVDTHVSSKYFLAYLTFDSRVFISTINGPGVKSYECTSWIKDHALSDREIPMRLKSTPVDDYIHLIHSMATVEIQWSNIFTFEKSAPFVLLITGSRMGDVHLWKVDAGFTGREEEFSWMCMDQYNSEVTSLVWLSKNESQGYLVVGYLDGSIRCLEVNASFDTTVQVSTTVIFADLLCDNISVADISFGETNEGTPVLLVSKLFFLFLYTFSDARIQFVKHFEVETSLPTTCLCTRGSYGVLSTQDGSVISLQVLESSDGITIKQTRRENDIQMDIPWPCMGTVLTPSSCICFSLYRTDYNSRSRSSKMKGKQAVMMTVPFNFDARDIVSNMKGKSVGTKDAVLNLCFAAKEVIDKFLSEPCKTDDVKSFFSTLTDLQEPEGSQIALGVLHFIRGYLSNSHLEKSLPFLQDNYDTALRHRISSHASSCLQNVYENMSDIDQRIASSLQNYQCYNEGKNQAEELQNNSLTCAICCSKVEYDGHLCGRCEKGHKMRLCVLTLLPCQDIKARKCEVCRQSAFSYNALKDCALIKNKHLCPLCGGHLTASLF